MEFRVIGIPQSFIETKKTLSASEVIERKINEMAQQGYEYVGVVSTSSEVHYGCCCCKKMYYKYENQLVFKR